MSSENNLRQSLFSAEPLSPERRRRFRAELSLVSEPPLLPRAQLYYKFTRVCLVIGICGAACGLLFDAEHRWVWALNLLVLAPSAAWIFHILRRGAEPLGAMQGMSKAVAGLVGIATIAMIMYGLQNPSMAAVLWSLLGIVASLLTSFINLWNRVITAERTLREDILRVEYRLADLASRLPPGEDKSS